ncbi:hypothetical protein ZHAS_00016372 [Anopheles sinensis]|uniref:Uncharacterized protein n=1 Tax=Anopheles sinensis TaxID=74873 RepID=A0A084WDF6_ANOSI|nr:hypothetical protein ZHAS_00016372 [Anopheles sinensis]
MIFRAAGKLPIPQHPLTDLPGSAFHASQKRMVASSVDRSSFGVRFRLVNHNPAPHKFGSSPPCATKVRTRGANFALRDTDHPEDWRGKKHNCHNRPAPNDDSESVCGAGSKTSPSTIMTMLAKKITMMMMQQITLTVMTIDMNRQIV